MSKIKTISQNNDSILATFIHRALVHGLGLLGLLITVCFFTATYDSAQVKLTLLQMGGITLLFLWAAGKIALRQNPFTREKLPFLLPVFVYIGWNICCYVLAPYHLEATEEFSRFIIYGGLTLLAATELKITDLRVITNYMLVAAWISFTYASVQTINIFFPGFDPMDWRGFFSNRVFSTHANPNFFADFVVFSSCIIATAYVISRKKSLLVLFGLGAVTLCFTESKGAWVAYACCAVIGMLLYTNTLASALKKHLKKINVIAATLILTTGLLVGYFSVKRFQSVSFRTHTWLSTLEMIKDTPVFGVGIGNFKVIYAAYKRPQIFYIENAHNVETQHAENEILEQTAVSGIPGLAIFLWLMSTVFYGAWKRLKAHENWSTQKEYYLYLLGYTTALAGMFVHSWVDVSIHFASSGFFFALFMGIILALLSPQQDLSTPADQPQSFKWVTVLFKIVLSGLWLTLAVFLIMYFREITAPLVLRTFIQNLLLYISWAVLLGALIAAGYISLRSAFLIKRWPALLLLCIVPPLLYGSFYLFLANHYYSLAITFSTLGKNDGAIIYFTRAVKGNPFQIEYRQFRANLLAAELYLNESFAPNRGDTKTPSNDFKRALRDFDAVEKASPNHPLLHHNRGQLYYTMALRRSDDATRAHNDAEYEQIKQNALYLMEQAKKSFERSLEADPTYEETYAFLIQIGLLTSNLAEAQQWLDRYEQGPAGVTEEQFLEPIKNNPRMKMLQMQINARKAQL